MGAGDRQDRQDGQAEDAADLLGGIEQSRRETCLVTGNAVIWFKICPVLLTGSAVLLLAASFT